MAERLPDFLGLGTQKGGTTTLHRLLSAHPQVFLPDCKEVHYFDQNHHHPPAWYAKHFQSIGRAQCCGDITPFYLFHPQVPQRIHALLPSARLVVLLRDPVERALSQIFHARKRGFEALSPTDAIAAEEERLASGCAISLQKHSYVARSRYLEQLDRYQALFPADQLLVLQSEALFEAPEPLWQRLLKFLDLAPEPLPPLPRANAGDGGAAGVDPDLRLKLRQTLAPTARGVRERYGFGWDWE